MSSAGAGDLSTRAPRSCSSDSKEASRKAIRPTRIPALTPRRSSRGRPEPVSRSVSGRRLFTLVRAAQGGEHDHAQQPAGVKTSGAEDHHDDEQCRRRIPPEPAVEQPAGEHQRTEAARTGQHTKQGRREAPAAHLCTGHATSSGTPASGAIATRISTYFSPAPVAFWGKLRPQASTTSRSWTPQGASPAKTWLKRKRVPGWRSARAFASSQLVWLSAPPGAVASVMATSGPLTRFSRGGRAGGCPAW